MLWAKRKITRGYSLAPDGTILIATITDGVGALSMMPAKGGDPIPVEIPGSLRGKFLYPEFLPDGKNILFALANDSGMGLYVATLENGRMTRAPILLRENDTTNASFRLSVAARSDDEGSPTIITRFRPIVSFYIPMVGMGRMMAEK